MKNKIIILLILVLFLTGCDATYSVEIKNGKVFESTNFYGSDSDVFENNADTFVNPNGPGKTINELVDDYYQQDYLAFYNQPDRLEYYEKEMLSYEDKMGIQLRYTYSLDEYQYSSLVHYCFDTVSVDSKNGIYTFQLQDSNKCFTQDVNQMLDTVTIQVTSNQIIEHNANQTNGSNYIWTLSKDSPNQIVYFKIKNVGNSAYFFVYIFMICIICGGISFSIVYILNMKKRRK